MNRNRFTCLFLMAASIIFCMTFASHADNDPNSSVVTAKPGAVKQDGIINDKDADEKFDDYVQFLPGIRIIGKTFTPPSSPAKTFAKFAVLTKPWDYVDVLPNARYLVQPESTTSGTTTTYTVGPNLIRIMATQVNATADAGLFPIQAEGNLADKPTDKQLLNWSAKVREPPANAAIEPDDGQAGVTGDVVGDLHNSSIKHYVSPKQSSSFVILKVVRRPEDTAGFATIYKWDPTPTAGTDVQPVTGSPDKVMVRRDTAQKLVINLKRVSDSSTVDTMNVWIIWATITAHKVADATVLHHKIQTPSNMAGEPGTYVATEWYFLATISPMTITDKTQNVPDLTGANTLNAPAASDLAISSGLPLAGGVNAKWDVSRQIRVRAISPAPVGTGDYTVEPAGAIFFEGLPNANKVVQDYPASDVVGNDDASTGDENNNPYAPGFVPQMMIPPATPRGTIASHDAPKLPVVRDGVAGTTIEFHAQFIEFVRVQIGSVWYRISDAAQECGDLMLASKKAVELGLTMEAFPKQITMVGEERIYMSGMWFLPIAILVLFPFSFAVAMADSTDASQQSSPTSDFAAPIRDALREIRSKTLRDDITRQGAMLNSSDYEERREAAQFFCDIKCHALIVVLLESENHDLSGVAVQYGLDTLTLEDVPVLYRASVRAMSQWIRAGGDESNPGPGDAYSLADRANTLLGTKQQRPAVKLGETNNTAILTKWFKTAVDNAKPPNATPEALAAVRKYFNSLSN